MIRNGFLIEDGKIFDTKIQSFTQKKEVVGENIIYSMTPLYYRRLYLFEALLGIYSINKVFRILAYNKYLKKERENETSNTKNHYMTNSTIIYNYPPTYLTKRKFILYKTCQTLKKKLD